MEGRDGGGRLRKVYLELSSRCNLSCEHCYRQTWSDEAEDMGIGAYEYLEAQILASASIETVVLGGLGEPSVSPLFRRAVAAFGGEGGKRLVVTSNGVGYGEPDIEALATRAELVMLSIDRVADGLGRLEATGSGGSLGEIVSAARRITEARRRAGLPGSNVGVQFVLSRDSAGEAEAVIGLAAELKARLAVVSHLLPQTPGQAAAIMYGDRTPPETAALFSRLSSLAMRRGLSLVLPQGGVKTERHCRFVEDGALVLTASGAAAPCYRLSHSYPEYVLGRRKTVAAHSFGDASRAAIDTIWNGDAYAAFRARIRDGLYPSCADCDLVEGCDLARDTSSDCFSGSPSCADCPWSRGWTLCP